VVNVAVLHVTVGDLSAPFTPSKPTYRSSAYRPKIFHWPLVMVQQLIKRGHDIFPQGLLDAQRIVQHLESGACAGGREKLRLVASTFEKRLSIARFRQTYLLS
jgi:hypothetical protein